MKVVFISIFLIMALSIKAQKNKSLLNNRTLIAKVGSMCEETPEPNPCAGRDIYLVLEFKKEEVVILEKYISSCDEEDEFELGIFKWELLETNQVLINSNEVAIRDTYLENLTLELTNGHLSGKIKNYNGSISEYIFIDILEQDK